jgi:hypothetical protein
LLLWVSHLPKNSNDNACKILIKMGEYSGMNSRWISTIRISPNSHTVLDGKDAQLAKTNQRSGDLGSGHSNILI